MDDDGEPHPGMAEAAELRAAAVIAAGFVGLDAQQVHMARHRVDLAGQARHPEGMDDVDAGDRDVDGNAGGQVQDVSGLNPALVGIAEGPDPLPSLGLDPAAARFPSAAAAARRRPAHRRRAAAGRRAGRTRPPSTIQRAGDTPDPQPGRRITMHEEDHDQREERGGARQHHPPQGRDRSRRWPGGSSVEQLVRCSRPAPRPIPVGAPPQDATIPA